MSVWLKCVSYWPFFLTVVILCLFGRHVPVFGHFLAICGHSVSSRLIQ